MRTTLHKLHWGAFSARAAVTATGSRAAVRKGVFPAVLSVFRPSQPPCQEWGEVAEGIAQQWPSLALTEL